MEKFIHPSVIKGEVQAPSSKSMMLRVIVAGLFAKGETKILNPSFCDDAVVALKISEQLGAKVNLNGEYVKITGGYDPGEEILHCGESGLCVRMFSVVAALHDSVIQLTGSGSMQNRPVSMMEKPLTELGVTCTTADGFIPVSVKGPITGKRALVDGSVSSQFLTGLLMSLPNVHHDSELFVRNLKSRPYIDLTLKILKDFGIEVKNQDYQWFRIKGKQEYRSGEYRIEGDWSGAAFLLVAGALNGTVTVHGIQTHSLQADRQVLSVLEMAGAKIQLGEDSVEISTDKLYPFRFNATESPDLFPPLVALAAHCEGISVITGTHRLVSKESNRALILQKEFARIGVPVEIVDDKMIIQGGVVNSGIVDSNNDHRIAMAATVAAIRAKGMIHVKGAECVTKSYPYFFNDFTKIGGIAYE